LENSKCRKTAKAKSKGFKGEIITGEAFSRCGWQAWAESRKVASYGLTDEFGFLALMSEFQFHDIHASILQSDGF